MKLRFTSIAEGGTSSSQAISPALLCERLRVYLLGSVWPILAANGVCAHNENALRRAKAQSIRSGYMRRIISVSSHGCQAGHILSRPRIYSEERSVKQKCGTVFRFTDIWFHKVIIWRGALSICSTANVEVRSSLICSTLSQPRTMGGPHISLVFREMWDSPALNRRFLVQPQWAKNPAKICHPSVAEGSAVCSGLRPCVNPRPVVPRSHAPQR